MNAFRFQTFSPDSDPVAEQALETERTLDAIRDEAYRAGYLAGQAAATEAYLQEQSRLTSELIEAINDDRLTNEAARGHVVQSLAPLVETLCATVAPTLADAGLAAEIGRLVDRAVELAPGARLRLRCAPELVGRMEQLFAERGTPATIEPAPELLPREAQVYWDQGFDHIDLDACIAQIHACLEPLLQSLSEGQTHDERRYG